MFIRSGFFRVFVLGLGLIPVSSFPYSKYHFPVNTRCISVPWDVFSEVLVMRFFQTLVSSDRHSVIFTAIRTSQCPMFCGFFSLVCLVFELALFFQSSETILKTWTKEVAAIGQAALDQNVPRSTTRRLWTIFCTYPRVQYLKILKKFQAVPLLKICHYYMSSRFKLSNMSSSSFINSL
jgi:hypothetical protein